MEFHDNYPQYEMMSHHSNEEGVHKRKKLWRVFWIMLVITLVELVIGFYADSVPRMILMITFIVFTILKAAYIVLSFMHLGDEKKAFKYTILVPFSLFIIYLIWIITTEGTYAGVPFRKTQMDKNIVTQQEQLKEQHKTGGTHHKTPDNRPGENTGNSQKEHSPEGH